MSRYFKRAKRRGQVFELGMILIALIVFIVIFSFLIEKKGRLEDEYRYGVGYRQARLVSMYSEGEGTLLYVDQHFMNLANEGCLQKDHHAEHH